MTDTDTTAIDPAQARQRPRALSRFLEAFTVPAAPVVTPDGIVRPTEGRYSLEAEIAGDTAARLPIRPPGADFPDEVPSRPIADELVRTFVSQGVAPDGVLREMPQTRAVTGRLVLTTANTPVMVAPAYNGPRAVYVAVSDIVTGSVYLHVVKPDATATATLNGLQLPNGTRETYTTASELWLTADTPLMVVTFLIDYTAAVPVVPVAEARPHRAKGCGCS